MRPSRFIAALAVIVVIGGFLRFWGIDFGLPFLYHGDEGEIVRRALRMPLDGPNPYWFQYPTLYVYMQGAAYVVLFAGYWLTGAASSYTGFAQSAAIDPTAVYVVGRGVTALLGAATVATTGLAARACFADDHRAASRAGLVAATLVAFNLLHVEHSHYVTPDIPMTFAASCALLFVARIAVSATRGTNGQYALAGLFVGIAASIKYPGALFAAAIVIVWAQRAPWREGAAILKDARLPLAGAASIAAFLAGSPFILLDFAGFQRDFLHEAAHMRQGHLGFEGVSSGWSTHLKNLYDSGNVALLVLFVLGAIAVFRLKSVFGRTLVLSVVLLFAFASRSNVLFARYLLPMLPMVAVIAAVGAVWIAQGRGVKSDRARDATLAVLVVAALSLPSFLVYHRLRLFSAEDTRTQAWRWIDATLRFDGERPRIAVEWKSVQTDPTVFSGVDAVPVAYDLARLQRSGVRFVVVTDRLYRRFLKAADVYPDQAMFYSELLQRGTPLATFSPYADDTSQLRLDDNGAARFVRGGNGPDWIALPNRRLAGPAIVVFEVPPLVSDPAYPAAPDDDPGPTTPDDRDAAIESDDPL